MPVLVTLTLTWDYLTVRDQIVFMSKFLLSDYIYVMSLGIVFGEITW